ncbi:MAG: endolytic transglycosylase MltG [Candidatus Latescibacterota bacterium]|nr:MAG: endolytic transglycosylase MltG [Candidatus Latescibacterota bacterium]
MIKRVLLITVGLAMVIVIISMLTLIKIVRTAPEVSETAPVPVLFTVNSGEPFSVIARRLSEEGLIKHRRAVSLYAWLRRYDRQVKAGTYNIARDESPRDIIKKLVMGDIHKVSVTIPEGFMIREIAGVLAAEFSTDSTSITDLFVDPDLRTELNVPGPTLEGYLFPDTYLIPWGSSPREIVRMMVRRLEEVFDDELRKRAREIELSRHEVLTLASIVEAETRLPKELPLVSAVYHNRLRRGMRLEADPTVAYGMGGYKGRLYYKDLEIDSPYNTYRYEGLPPGPICNPGEAAIRATLYPDTTCHAIYFVAEGNGGHIFSLTLEDHLSAIQKVKRSRSAGQDGN